MKKHRFEGIDLVVTTYHDLYKELCERLSSHTTTSVVTPNPEMLYDAGSDPELMRILQKSDYALPDGAGLFVAYQANQSRFPHWLQYSLLPAWCLRAILHDSGLVARYGERITGSRLTADLLRYCAAENIPVVILDREVRGDGPGDIRKRSLQPLVSQKISAIFPTITVCHIVSDDAREVHQQIQTLSCSYALILGTHGGGTQEKILTEIQSRYPTCMTVGIGGSIDLLTGFRRPAPWFFRRFGGEWLYRCILRPRVHFQRMRKVMKFILSSLSQS